MHASVSKKRSAVLGDPEGYVADVTGSLSGEIEMRNSFPAQGPPQYPGFHHLGGSTHDIGASSAKIYEQRCRA